MVSLLVILHTNFIYREYSCITGIFEIRQG